MYSFEFAISRILFGIFYFEKEDFNVRIFLIEVQWSNLLIEKVEL